MGRTLTGVSPLTPRTHVSNISTTRGASRETPTLLATVDKPDQHDDSHLRLPSAGGETRPSAMAVVFANGFGAGLCDRLARSCHLCAGSLDGTASFQGKSNCVSTCTLTSPPMPSRQLHNPGLRYFLSELPEGVSRSVPGTAESR